jgi:hypothetical protein
MKYWCKVFSLSIILATVSAPAFPQVAPAATGGNSGRIFVFGEFSAGRPNYGDEFLLGPTLGGYIRFSHLIGVEARGSILRWGPSPLHQATALFGPRVQLTLGRFVPYGSFDVGIGHAVYPVSYTSRQLTSSDAFAWQVAGGVDYRLNRRFKLRLGEYTYGSISVLNGLNPKTFSSGVVVRLF